MSTLPDANLSSPAADIVRPGALQMTRHGVWFPLVALLALGCPRTNAAMPATGPAIAGFEAYDQIIPPLLEEGHLPGAAVAVAYRGRIVFARGYGFADRDTGRPMQPDTRLRIGSISKTFTAALVLKLVEEGRISLEDRAFPLLGYATPTYAGARRDPRLDRVTVRQLLNHTGGWDFYTAQNPLTPGQVRFDVTSWPWHVAQTMRTASPATAETMVRFMVGQPLQAEPGTIWSYTNFGYLALGRLIEQKTGLGYEEAVKQFVGNSYLSGLAIGATHRGALPSDEAAYYDYPNAPLWYLYNQFESGSRGPLVPRPYAWDVRGSDAAGGWTASAIEILRFLLALDGLNGTPPLLKPESIAAMRTATPLSTFLHYGLGWCVSNANNTDPQGTDSGHGGGHNGSTSYALRSADGEWHMVALLNGSVDTSNGTNVNRMNTAVSLALHRLPDFGSTPPAHDLTWSTLGWDAWQRRHGSGATSPLEDTDGDGLSNLVEYATGLNPAGLDLQPPASLAMGPDGQAVFTHRRLILDHPLAWTAESTNDGLNWEVLRNEVPSVRTLNNDGTLSVSLPASGANRVRLRVRQAATAAEAVFEATPEPQQIVVREGESATLCAVAPSGVPLQWRRNGAVIPGATTAALVLANVGTTDAGIYTIDIGSAVPSTRVAAIVALRSSVKVIGAGEIVDNNIRHPNGNIYDQVLLTGAAATITADPGQITRISYVDLSDDIVQVEFSGPGSLTLALTGPAERALPRNYRQDVRYVKGHATIVVSDATADTHVSVFSVGRANALNQSLFKDDVAYDGVADLAVVAILSGNAKAGGLYLGNAHLFAASGATGIYATGVDFAGPVRVGNVSAFDRAVPALLFGSVDGLSITGGDLYQDNGATVATRGLKRVVLVAGGRSTGAPLAAQPNRGRLALHGCDVTAHLTTP